MYDLIGKKQKSAETRSLSGFNNYQRQQPRQSRRSDRRSVDRARGLGYTPEEVGAMLSSSPFLGRELDVPERLSGRIQDSFGMNSSDMHLRESPEVATMNARAIGGGLSTTHSMSNTGSEASQTGQDDFTVQDLINNIGELPSGTSWSDIDISIMDTLLHSPSSHPLHFVLEMGEHMRNYSRAYEDNDLVGRHHSSRRKDEVRSQHLEWLNLPYEIDQQTSEEINRHLLLVHGSVIQPTDPTGTGPGHWTDHSVMDALMVEFGIGMDNVAIPDWVGRNRSSHREAGGELIAEYLKDILRNNPYAEILLAGYSHGGNVAKHGLNLVQEYLDAMPEDDRQFNLNNVTLLGSGTPAFHAYQLNENTRDNINAHLNFFNNRDWVQRQYSPVGSTAHPDRGVSFNPWGLINPFASPITIENSDPRIHVQGYERGRAQFPHENVQNIEVDNHVPRGRHNIGGSAAHSAMVNNRALWEHYHIPAIREAKEEMGW